MNTPNTNSSNDRDATDLNYREEWLSAYLDDELNPPQRAVVEQRIAVDAEATLMLQDLERIRGLVGSLPAWRGRDLQVPLTGLLPDNNADDTPTAALATRPDGDFHDELQPQPSRSSGSDARATARDQAASSMPTSRSFGRPRSRWLRPVALAASLLFVIGAGLLIWPQTAPWSVATSTRINEQADERKSKTSAPLLAEPTEQPQESTSMFAQGSIQDAAELPETLDEPSAEASLQLKLKLPEAGQASNFSNDRGEGGEPLHPPTALTTGGASDREPDTMQRGTGKGFDDQVNALSAPASAAESFLPRREEKRHSDGGTALDGAAQPKLLAPESSSQDKAVALPAPIQLAHSAAWNESEIGAGLARLAPLLNLSPAVQASAAKDQQSSREGSELAPRAAAEFEIPVAVAPREHAQGSGSHLVELLQQNSFALVGITADGALPALPGLTPFGTATHEAPATIALFVDRAQAEKILQAAKQAGEISANPVWIRSASTRDVPLDNQQKVVVLFAPQ